MVQKSLTIDEEAILSLARENQALRKTVQELRAEILRAGIAMSNVGVPSSFEDGNSSDDLSFTERVSTLCEMYKRAKGTK